MTASIIELRSYQAQLRTEQGLKLASKGKYIQAQEFFEQALSFNREAKTLTYMAWIKFHLGRLDLAIDLCHEALKMDSELPEAYNDLGSYYLEKGILDQAERYLLQALKFDNYKSKHFAHINLAKLCIKKTQKEKAISHLELALDLSPGNWEITKILAELRYQQKSS